MNAAVKTRLKHVGIVALCFPVSIVIGGVSCPFAGPSTPDALFFILGCVVASHVFALVVSVAFPKLNWCTVAAIVAICVAPALFFAAHAITDNIHLRYFAVWDRFRDTLADPIPSSVKGLRFTTLEETINPDLGFRFDIDPDDLRAIIQAKKLKNKDPDELKCPRDFFKHPYYLPLPGKYVLYQGPDQYGDILTLKVNEEHTHAIFRKESEGYYRYRYWEGPPVDLKQTALKLERMRKEYEAKRPAPGNRRN